MKIPEILYSKSEVFILLSISQQNSDSLDNIISFLKLKKLGSLEI